MALNTKVTTQFAQVLAITDVYGGCQCIKLGCHFTRDPLSAVGLQLISEAGRQVMISLDSSD